MATRKKTAAKGRKPAKPAKAATRKKATKTTASKAAKGKAKTVAKTKAKTTAKAKKATTTRKSIKRATTAKSTARKSTAKVTKKPSTFNLPATAITAKQTKAQIIAEISEMTQLPKPDVKKVFSALKNLVERHVKPKGSGEVTIPELGIKIRRVVKKATKARMGRNPFTGEEIKIAAKPARKSVKATALKALKELA